MSFQLRYFLNLEAINFKSELLDLYVNSMEYGTLNLNNMILNSLIYKAIIVIFSVNLSIVNIYKFCKIFDPTTWRTSNREQPGEQHLGDVRPKKFELHKIL